MKEVWLIRHAESLANIGAATSTPREIPLSDNGFRQADELAEMIGKRPGLIVVSPYVRTRQTAEPLLQRFPDIPVEILAVQEFTYLSISRCRGTNAEQRRPWVDEYWQRADPNYCDGDQAESFVEFIERVERFVNDMSECEFDLAYVFTHEQVIKALIWCGLQVSAAIDSATMSSFQKFMVSFKIPNASIVMVKMDVDMSLYLGKILSPLLKNNA